MPGEEKLSADSLEWALRHLQRFGDSDILPTPFEYEAVSAHWAGIRERLQDVDLSHYEPRGLQRFLVPKPEGGFRVATRLDPIDAILYTAVVYEASPAIENSRLPRRSRIACSYRLRPKADGSWFGDDNGWENFYECSLELSKQKRIGWVVLTDVSDFYSQVGHHRIENALEDAGLPRPRAQAIERLLSDWSALQSRSLQESTGGTDGVDPTR